METRPPPPDDGFLPLVSSAEWGGRATRAEVHLDALAANVRAFRQLIGERSLMAVLKANAYGHGASMVARTALSSGAQWLGVYAVEEAVALREHGIEAPILVFGPFERGEAQDIWRHRLTPTVAEPESAETLQRAACGQHR